MSDERSHLDPLLGLTPADEDEELLQEAIRRVTARENQRHSEETTGEDGNPLPRLDLADLPPTTDDPLLRVGYALLPHLPDVAAACAELRRSMYEADGRGAWYTAFIRLNANGTIVARYDNDGPPFMFWGPTEVALPRRDQELYPRPPERLPAWHPAR